MADIPALIMQMVNTPDTKPFLYPIGGKARVLVGVVNDGQTPKCWAGAVCTVERHRTGMFYQTHGYWLRHPNGTLGLFKEEELDRRYARR